MTTYRTGNAIGSADPRDLYDNSENLDEWVTSRDKTEHPDRLGVPRKTWHGMERDFDAFLASAGYQDLGDYAPGIEITARNQVIRAEGELWRLSASEDLPYITTGAGMPEGGAFVAVGDAVLRQELGDPAQGGELVSVTTSTGSQTVVEALERRNLRVNSIADLASLGTGNLAEYQSAVITTTGRAGIFTWMPGDRSAKVDDDPQQGIWVAPDDDQTGVNGAWMRQYNRWGTVDAQWFGAVDDFDWDAKTGTNNQAAIQAALDTGINVHCPTRDTGMYRVDGKQLLINHFQSLSGDGCGSSYGPNPDQTHVTKTDLVFTGEGQAYVQTRRLARESPSDPNDPALAVGVNMQHEGAMLRDIAVRLWVDYGDPDPQNMGDSFDVGVLVGCAQDQLENVRVYGYWRRAAIWLDGTKSSQLPRFSTPEGVAHAPVTFTGTDQVKMRNVLTKGGWKGLFIAGAQNGSSGDYYDEMTDATYPDEGGRGAAGMSDFHAIDCTFWGPDHHSEQRRVDPRGDMNFDAEDINALAGGLFIDGRRSPGALGGRTRRHMFTNLRVRSFEAVRIGLGRCSETYFFHLHTETSPGATVTDTNGDPITHGSSSVNYGSIAVTTPTDSESDGQVGTTGVYVHGINGVVGIQHFRSKFKRWDIISTGGGSTGGRSYFNDLRVGDENITITPVNTSFDLSGNFLVKNGGTNSFIVTGSAVTSYRILRPAEDNSVPCGAITARWTEIRAVNSTINTSDAREKQGIQDSQPILPISDEVLDAWGDVEWMAYRWNHAVDDKGGDARVHFGLVAQQVVQAFESHGLDPYRYGLICYDEWDYQPEQVQIVPAVYDDDGSVIEEERQIVVEPERQGGSRYGVRYDEAQAVEAAYQRRRMARIEARIAALGS